MKLDGKLKLAIAIFAIVFIFANVLVFLIPFPHGIAFWIAYAFLMVALVVEFFISYISTEKAFCQKGGIRYYPLMRTGAIYLIVQGIASLIFFLTDSYITMNIIWIPPVVCLIIFGVFCGLLVATYSGIKIVEKEEEASKIDTSFVSSLIVDVDVLRNQAKNTECKSELASLYETVRYSDPVSSPELSEIEQMIRGEMDVLKAAVLLNDMDKAGESIQKISDMVYERNQKCKLLK